MEFGRGKEVLVLHSLVLVVLVLVVLVLVVLVLVVLVWPHSLVQKFLPPMEEPVQFRETRRRPHSTLIPKPLLGVNLILQPVGLHGRKLVD